MFQMASWWWWSVKDRIAATVGIWAVEHLFGSCSTDIREEYPDDPTVQCIGCDAMRVILAMRDIADAKGYAEESGGGE